MAYRVLIGAVIGVHVAFLAYVVLGGLLAIRWPRLFWPHLVAAGWGLFVSTLSMDCPLTWTENWVRQQAGEPMLTRGFIDTYIEGVLYPGRYTWLVHILVALVVLGSWLLAYRRLRSRRA
ncbi:DUF2784 domain-containing protein [Planosporangium flavigriseum]|uniref:DUF2784 domain-containing protein n=1 Tax=Planosporangium flavigriseum TaxID=373681 RepID=A0A8J3LKA2_9ACTN|nr:DUF2784 domain-containing protein [Planosporangium flavigriseum]NJC64048.1 DUF2784 domain-containing protein [Planosporangium flavigriseum]GIG72929.1 hypothetical protein Pfl04_13330 [Planosporangium flavigriseum]